MRTLLIPSLALLVATSTLATSGSPNAPAGVSSTLVYRDGHVTYTLAPRVPEGGRLLLLLAFPRAPELTPIAPAAVEALHAIAALEPLPEGGERTTPSLTDPLGTSVRLLNERAALEEWWQTHGAELEDEVLQRGIALLQRRWTLVALSGDHRSPAFAFRFQADGPFPPPNLLRDDDERAREPSSEATEASDGRNRVLRLLNKIWGH